MFSLALLLCCLGALASSAPQKVFYDLDNAYSYFEEFIQSYNKVYKNQAEAQARFEIFRENLADINEKNQKDQSAVFGINEFTDMTQEEFITTYTGYLPFGGETACRQMTFNATQRVPLSDSLDWRQRNKVTSVKNQGQCGSCWAFSTVGTIEGQYAMQHNQLVDLAPQQLVDCVQGANGCQGGWMSTAILSLAQFGGVMREQDYPYQMRDGQCRADTNRIAVRVTGCRQFMLSSEQELKQILAQVGPISIAVAASQWSNYRGGVLKQCDQSVNHAVLLVGYGSENGSPYWIIKNSWGPGWGESGYIRMSMGTNTCNLMGGQFVTATVQ